MSGSFYDWSSYCPRELYSKDPDEISAEICRIFRHFVELRSLGHGIEDLRVVECIRIIASLQDSLGYEIFKTEQDEPISDEEYEDTSGKKSECEDTVENDQSNNIELNVIEQQFFEISLSDAD